ncbi:toll/interleukin-1 receptor domain-containing protein [Frankia sp. Cr1]|uniref:toll/interleukin-1 receptor domain-containing protein n=1 Tax=Frankia sp. Cr1 TaxID=3073931 RepID=UPI002AD4B856|nr:toll/interleukin-1 receptor domain-containing protein [Frankia sp. Cr1]
MAAGVLRIFVNYRGTGSAWAVLLDRELSARFGPENVFRASRSIRPSEDFADRILGTVRRSSVLLAIIGPDWLDARSPDGRRRIDDEKDWVRREIAEALAWNVAIIPVLVDDVPRPVAAELPPELARLARCQYLRLNHRNAEYDLARLVQELHSLPPGPSTAGGPVESGPALVDPDHSRADPDHSRAGPSDRRSSSVWRRKPGAFQAAFASLAVIVVAAVVVLTSTIGGSRSNGGGTSPASEMTADRGIDGTAGVSAGVSAEPTLGDLRPGRRAELGPEDHLDVETGVVGNAVGGLDLYFPTEGSPIQSNLIGAVDPAVVAPLAAGGLAGCAHALDAYRYTTINLKATGVGGSFCVRTVEGNTTMATIISYSPVNPQRLILELTTQ